MEKELSTKPPQPLKEERWELLTQVDNLTEKPIVVLSFIWLGLLILDLTVGLNPVLQVVSNVIWVLFILDFLLKFVIAPHKFNYLKQNLLTVISLALPALRILRIFRALRFLRLARAARSINLVRVITSLNRGMRAMNKAIGKRGIGYVVALTLIVTLAGAAAMAQFESPTTLHDEGITNTNGIGSYGEGLWWTAMIMTTMGSEYWPKTVEGRVLGWLLSLYAFAIFGYITATIASYFVGQDKAKTDSEIDKSEVAGLRQELEALRLQMATLITKLDHDANTSKHSVIDKP
jgi:voltage-gated potassium channel